jgi:hypothetical protein
MNGRILALLAAGTGTGPADSSHLRSPPLLPAGLLALKACRSPQVTPCLPEPPEGQQIMELECCDRGHQAGGDVVQQLCAAAAGTQSIAHALGTPSVRPSWHATMDAASM